MTRGTRIILVMCVFIIHWTEARDLKSGKPHDEKAAVCINRDKREQIPDKFPKSRLTCVVGAGISGMSAARRLNEAGEKFTMYEGTAHVGGTWRYDPHVGTDSQGRPVHSSMYLNLRSNVPKQMMELNGFPLPEDMASFPGAAEYYEYLLAFADHFDLKKYIKFQHKVTAIIRVDDHWKLKYRNIISREEFEENCDYVIIGNGHFSKPKMPNLPGEDSFKGTIIHSHDFRDTKLYQNQRVLVVGAGPSGVDIGNMLSADSSKLVHSHHSLYLFRRSFPENYTMKPDVKEFKENGVVFTDDTFEEIDHVVFCTGYKNNYPFLDQTSGLSLQQREVSPLYRRIVNIHQPTMLLLGVNTDIVGLDAQAQYAVAVVTGKFRLPSEQDMLNELQELDKEQRMQGAKIITDLETMKLEEEQYYGNLTSEAGVTRVPPVFAALRKAVVESAVYNYRTFRNFHYTVLDDRHFTRELRPSIDAVSFAPHSI